MPDYDLGTARGRIELDASTLGRASAAFASLGRDLLGFGALAVGGFAYVAKSAADFEHALSAVQAVSGATSDEMDLLREKALELGSTSVYSADQVVGAFENLAKAGVPVQDILSGAGDAVLKLAQAAGTELPGGIEQAAEVMANAMKTFDVGADQAEHFADVLVAAAASSTTSVDDLATSLRYVGPQAHELGLSIDDVSAALAILGDRGIKGSMAGTSLRGVLLSLTGTSGPAKSALKDLGLITEDGTNKFFDMNGALKPLPEVMQILQDATKGLSEEEKQSAFNAIFQRRAMNAAMVLADQGAAGFDKYAESIAKLNASDIAATKLDNLSGDMTILKNSIQVLIIRAGEPLQAMLRGWVQHLTGVVKWLQELNPHTLSFIARAIGIAGAISAIVGAGFLFISMGLRMYKMFRDLVEGIKLLISGIQLLSTSLLASPWFWVIAAIVALGVAFYEAYQHSQAFRDFVDGLVDALKNYFLPIIEAVKRAFSEFWTVLTTGMTENEGGTWWENLAFLIRDVGHWLRDVLIPAFSEFWTVLTTGMTENEGGSWWENLAFAIRDVATWIDKAVQVIGGWQTVLIAAAVAAGLLIAPFTTVAALLIALYTQFDGFREVVNSAAAAIATLGSEIVERLQSGFDWLQTNVFPVIVSFAELVEAVVQRVSDAWGLIAPFVQVQMGAIMGFISAFTTAATILWDAFGTHIWNFIDIIFEDIKGIVEGAMTIIRGIIDTVTALIKGDWSGVWDGIKEILDGVWQIMGQLVETTINTIKEVISTTIDGIKGIWEAGWNLIKDLIQIVWDTIQGIVHAVFDDISGFIEDRLENIKDAWNTAWDAVSSKVSEIWEAIKTTVSDAVWSVIGFVADLASSIVDKASGMFDPISNAFSSMLDIMKAGWNMFARFWNSIEVDLPSVDIPGVGTIGGGTFGLPDLPLFDAGGLITDPTLGLLSMNRVPEIVSPVPTLEGLFQKYSGTAPVELSFTFNGVSREDIPEIKRAITGDDVLGELLTAARAGRRN